MGKNRENLPSDVGPGKRALGDPPKRKARKKPPLVTGQGLRVGNARIKPKKFGKTPGGRATWEF